MFLKGATPKGIGMGLMPLEKQVQVLAASKKDEPSKHPASGNYPKGLFNLLAGLSIPIRFVNSSKVYLYVVDLASR